MHKYRACLKTFRHNALSGGFEQALKGVRLVYSYRHNHRRHRYVIDFALPKAYAFVAYSEGEESGQRGRVFGIYPQHRRG